MQSNENGRPTRRGFVTGMGAAWLLVGCHDDERGEENGAIITPGEDLMGEHGIVRRVIVVWNELAERLRRGESIDTAPLGRSVDVVQWFIERYHERTEETEVFPRLEHAGREVELVRTLRAQHEVGRAITTEMAALAQAGVTDANRARLTDLLSAHARMYAAHASREDTVIFPALREIVGREWAEMGERFEENEHRTLGEGAWERALAQVVDVERAYGLDALAFYTPTIV